MNASVMVALGSLVLLAGDNPDALLQADLKQLQGTWVHVSTEQFGVKRPEPRTLWVFEGNRARVHFSDRPHDVDVSNWRFRPEPINHLLTHQFTLDPAQSPKALDEQTEYKASKTLTSPPRLGIYKLEGDTLTICLAGYHDNGQRPSEFTVAKESDRASTF